jgi:glycine oxidase
MGSKFLGALLLLESITSVGAFQLPFQRSFRSFRTLRETGVQDVYQDGEAEFLGGTPDPPTISPTQARTMRVEEKDVVIVGGGLAGLSTALYLSEMDPDRRITILEREDPSQTKTAVASFAAAGMLAPQSERLPSGPLLDLCIASRRLYADFVELVENLAASSGEAGKQYLTYGDGTVGYVASGGFLAPAFAGDTVATWAPPEGSGSATWLDNIQVRELEPSLHPSVVGGWWFPEDASVDARRLTCSLRAACVALGVEIQTGKDHEVKSLDLVGGHCNGLWTENGKYLKAKSVLVANGAWMRSLLPVPIEPHKGQSLSLRWPSDQPPILRRVLFAQDTYICPKADGRIVIGATVEVGSYDCDITPAGMIHILQHALELVPGLKNLPIEETWAGLRPTTPDKGPILGRTTWDNLFLAGGYWRNGVLLAPKTGELMASLIAGKEMSPSDDALLKAFSWDRFTSREGAAKLAVNTRYAASMHPVQRRSQGLGVAAAVGTELGSYSNARNAREERQQDRSALFDEGDDAMERAAQLGIQDGSAFNLSDLANKKPNTEMYNEQTFDGYTAIQHENARSSRAEELDAMSAARVKNRVDSNGAGDLNDSEAELPSVLVVNVEEDRSADSNPSVVPSVVKKGISQNFKPMLADILSEKAGVAVETKVAVSSQKATKPVTAFESLLEADDSNGLNKLYKQIKNNKASSVEMGDHEEEERADPGFRILFIDNDGERHEVPPFTRPEEMVAIVAAKKGPDAVSENPQKKDVGEQYNEETFDGYTTIQQANSRSSREEELDVMKEARRKNRFGGSGEIDLSKIGAQRMNE